MAATKPRARPVKPDPAVDLSKLERDLATVFKRWSKADDARNEAEANRNRVIRDAHAGGVTPTRIAELAQEHGKGISTPRVHQIINGTRYGSKPARNS